MEKNNEAMETDNFYYEDIVDGVNMLLTKETVAIYSEAGISKKEILDKVEENLPPIYDNETLDAYCKRFLQFILIDQLNNNFADNVDQKARLNRVPGDTGEKPHVDPEILKKYLDAYESGDYARVYNTISTASSIFTIIGRNKAKPHYMDRTQLKVYQKYINDFRKKLLNEFSKVSIPQPVYEDAEENFEDEIDHSSFENVEEEVVQEVENIEDNDVIEEINGLDDDELLENETEEIIEDVLEDELPDFGDDEIEDETDFEENEKYELEQDEEYAVEDEEDTLFEDAEEFDDELPGFEEETAEIEEDDKIDTSSILASIDELDDVVPVAKNEIADFEEDDELSSFDDEEELDDELPGLEEEETTELDTDELPSFEDEEELDDELPGLEEEISELEEDDLPSFDDEEDLDDELPGLEEETSELDADELPSFEDEEELDDELPGLEDEESSELDADELPSFEDEEEFDDELPGLEEETTELEEDDLPSFDDEEELDDELPGLDEEETSELNEDELPSFEDEEELDDELPGLEEETTELDEDDLPSFDDEEELDDELPGLEETSELDEDELPSFDDEEEFDEEDELAKNELESLEEELSEIDESLSSFKNNNSNDNAFDEDELPSFEDEEEVEDELPGLEEETSELDEDDLPSFDDDEEIEDNLPVLEETVEVENDDLSDFEESSLDELPGLEEEEISESEEVEIDEEDSLDSEEEPEIIDERRNYDLVFEDNYYDILEVSAEYLEAHPNFKDSKFVEATGGTNLDDFISTMLYLKDNEKTEVVGIFNNVALYTHELYTVDDIEAVYDKLVEDIDEEDGSRKSKSECISYDEYYNQYIQRDVSGEAAKYQKEHKEIKMILIPQDDVTLEEFVEATMYFIQDDMTGTALKYNNISVIASDYSNAEEILNALSRETLDDQPEEVMEETINEEPEVENTETVEVEETKETEEVVEEGEVFDKSPEYYKSIAKISKNKTDAYREKHPECKKVMIVVERDSQTPVDFFEAVRYYNSINKNIIAQYDGVQLIARKYNSAEEMIEAYEIKKSKKAK